MKKKLLLSLLVLGFPLVLLAEDTATSTKAAEVLPVKKVTFNAGTNTKSPFMSQAEVDKLAADKKAAILAAQEKERIEKERLEKERAEMLRKQILCDELKRHPSRIVSGNIKVDGIMGKDAIVNGSVVSQGKKITVTLVDVKEKGKEMLVKDIEYCGLKTKNLKIKVVSVKDDSVWLVYKGERFQVKLPLM